MDTVAWVVPELIAHGKVLRPTLGIEFAADWVMRRIGAEGALVVDVISGSGAEKAGIQPTRRDRRGRVVLGDLVVAVDGQPVRSSGDIYLILEGYREGDQVDVTVSRDGNKRDLKIRLGKAR